MLSRKMAQKYWKATTPIIDRPYYHRYNYGDGDEVVAPFITATDITPKLPLLVHQEH